MSTRSGAKKEIPECTYMHGAKVQLIVCYVEHSIVNWNDDALR